MPPGCLLFDLWGDHPVRDTTKQSDGRKSADSRRAATKIIAMWYTARYFFVSLHCGESAAIMTMSEPASRHESTHYLLSDLPCPRKHLCISRIGRTAEFSGRLPYVAVAPRLGYAWEWPPSDAPSHPLVWEGPSSNAPGYKLGPL